MTKKVSPFVDQAPERGALDVAVDRSVAPDIDLLTEVLRSDSLRDDEREAFADMLDRIEQGTVGGLSPKQRTWAENVRKQQTGEPDETANTFSNWSEKKQAEEQRRAAGVKLPWERSDGTRAPMPRPPGRKTK